MDDETKAGNSSRYKPGQSGSRKCRPHKTGSRETSSIFEELHGRRIPVTLDGIDRELTIAEALLLKTYQAALAGDRMAIRVIIKKIKEHEAARVLAKQVLPTFLFLYPHPRDVDEAMLLLGIATRSPHAAHDNGRDCLILASWAVGSGLKRRKGHRLNNKEIGELQKQTCNPEAVTWPLRAET